MYSHIYTRYLSVHGASRVFGVFAADGTLVSERVVHGATRVFGVFTADGAQVSHEKPGRGNRQANRAVLRQPCQLQPLGKPPPVHRPLVVVVYSSFITL